MSICVKDLGRQDYMQTYDAMREFNEQRNSETVDEIWLLEHEPVYTLGLSENEDHLLNTNNIPVIKTDRGGQVTYHGPGQMIAYLLIDLNRRPYKIKRFVNLIEQSIIDYLEANDIYAERKKDAPGVYVNGEKIAALGVRVRKICSYHGLALNVNLDLKPFEGINPCGFSDLKCTKLSNYIQDISVEDVKSTFPAYLIKNLDVVKNSFSNVA